MLKTIVDDITNDLPKLNVAPTTAKRRLEMNAFFRNIIRNISEAKQLSRNTSADFLQKSLLQI